MTGGCRRLHYPQSALGYAAGSRQEADGRLSNVRIFPGVGCTVITHPKQGEKWIRASLPCEHTASYTRPSAFEYSRAHTTK